MARSKKAESLEPTEVVKPKRTRKSKQAESPAGLVETPLQAPDYNLSVYTPDETLPVFPVKLREKFPPLPEGFEARGTQEAAGVRVTRHPSGDSALQFKDGAAMGFAEKVELENKGYRYVPGDKQWANPEASWSNKLKDAQAISDARLKDRER